MYRAHPIMIVYRLKKYLFILIIPVMNGILTFLQDRSLVPVLALELLLLIAIIFLAVIERYNTFCDADYDEITLQSGLIFRKSFKIKKDRISTMTVSRSAVVSLFKGVKLSIDTEAGSKRKADYFIILYKKDAEKILKNARLDSARKERYRPKIKTIFFTALVSSNVAVGLILSAPVIKQTGDLIGSAFTSRLTVVVDTFAEKTAVFAPKIASVVAFVLMSGWAISFFVFLFRYANFKVFETGGNLLVTKGLIGYKKTLVSKDNICAVVLTQTPLMVLFRLYSCKIYVAGYGKAKGEVEMLFISLKRDNIQELCKDMLRTDFRFSPKIKPVQASILMFLWLPAALSLSTFITGMVLFIYFKEWQGLTAFVSSVLILWLSGILWILIKGFKISGFRALEKGVEISGKKGLKLFSAYLPKSKIASVHLKQNVLQQKSKTCTVFISLLSERVSKYQLKGIKKQAAIEEFKAAGYF